LGDAHQYPGLTADAGRAAEDRLSKRALLCHVPIFEALPGRLLTTLARRCDVIAVGAGTVLVTEGARADAFYVLVHGSVAFTQADEDVSASSVSGTTIALGSVLSNRPPQLTATARHDSELLRFRAREFWQISSASPELLRAVVGALTTLLMAGRTDALST
jgi:CRP-like cAMP-binding protein